MIGVEPTTFALQVRCTANCATSALVVMGELESPLFQLSVGCFHQLNYITILVLVQAEVSSFS